MKFSAILTTLILPLIKIGKATTNRNVSLLVNEFESKCEANGDLVCMNCQTQGNCTLVGSFFEVTAVQTCPPGSVCDPAIGNDCNPLSSASSPICMCDVTGLACLQDPSDNLSYVECNGNSDPSYGTCTIDQEIDYATCSCTALNCPACGSKPYSDTECTRYIYCAQGTSAVAKCTGDFCYDVDSCACVPTCPPCGFKPGPDNNQYIYCGGGDEVLLTCSGGGTFNNTTCVCDTASMATTANPCPVCGYLPYPGDDTKFFDCSSGQNVEGSCPPGFVFDPNICFCI